MLKMRELEDFKEIFKGKKNLKFITLTSKNYWYTSAATRRAAEYFYKKTCDDLGIWVTENHKSGFYHIHGIIATSYTIEQMRIFALQKFGRNRIVNIKGKYREAAIKYCLKYVTKGYCNDANKGNTWDIYISDKSLFSIN